MRRTQDIVTVEKVDLFISGTLANDLYVSGTLA